MPNQPKTPTRSTTSTSSTAATEYDRGYRDGKAGRYDSVTPVTGDYQKGFKAGWEDRKHLMPDQPKTVQLVTRLWFTVDKGYIRGVQRLTDESALAKLERGDDIRPVGDAAQLAEILRESTNA